VKSLPLKLQDSILKLEREDIYSVFGCNKKLKREKEVRTSMRREKDERNRVDLRYYLL